jgi:hypothetical protein
MRIQSRSIEEVSWDLDEIEKRKFAHIVGLASRYNEGLAKEIGSIVAGCFELLVAEAFSLKIGLKYFLSRELESPPCIVWNGRLDILDNRHVPKCAPRGKPDIEVYMHDGVWIVDATLAGDKGVQLAEARRLKRHNPTITSNITKRILVTLSPKIEYEDIEIIEVKTLIPTTPQPKRGRISYVEEVNELIKEKLDIQRYVKM